MLLNCGHFDAQSARLDALLAQGKSVDAVKAAFVREFGGQQVLAAPIDRGFNRLAWAVPYLAGVLTLGLVILAARRWGSPGTSATAADGQRDPMLDSRLDDELRNLD